MSEWPGRGPSPWVMCWAWYVIGVCPGWIYVKLVAGGLRDPVNPVR